MTKQTKAAKKQADLAESYTQKAKEVGKSELDLIEIRREREIAAARHDVETGEADDSLLMVLNQEMNEVKADPIVQEYAINPSQHYLFELRGA